MSKKISLEKLASIPSIMMVEPNKNRDKIGFYWNKTKRNEFYILDLNTGKYNQITDGELPKAIRAGYLWLDDNLHITYTRDKDGDEQHDMFLFNIETRESTRLTETPEAQEVPSDISPNGKKLLFNSTRAGQMNLFAMDLETKNVEQLTKHKNPVWSQAFWSKTGWIYYSYNDTKNLNNSDIWAVKEDGSESKLILQVTDDSLDGVSDLSDNGKYLAITSNASGVNRAGVFNLETNELTWLGEGKYDESAVQFSKDSKKLVVLRNKEAEIRPVIYDLENAKAKELNFKGVTFNVNFCMEDKYLVYIRTDPKTPMMLAKYNLETEEESILIPPQTDLSAEDFYDMEYIKYPSFDGLEIAATLYKPKLEPGKKYPALVHVHGGPTGQYFQNFDIFSQVFAHEGFVILNPNIRGSTGYGKEFQDMNIKDWGGGDGKDVVWAKKFLETLDYVDPERIGVFGGSYGGYMTFMQMTKYADAGWKCGSAWIGISRIKTFYDQSRPHFKYFIERFFGKYEDNKELWEEASALNHIEKIRAPIQMIHGVNDPRCPVGESRQFRDKLLEMGWKEGKEGDKTFEYVEFGDEGHGAYSDISMRIRTFRLFLDFFKRRL
ncbi:MAG: S9 family peptidase [Candidatus Heimdallarchaeaceae archaeon]